MGHAESPSLISLGLATDVSQESSSFRWGLVTSCFFHALVIVIAVFLRFQSTMEEPFRAIDVALISLPEAQAPAPNKEKASRPTPSPPKTQPREETLSPLPTQTATERLSEFLGGAVGSIVVPQKQEVVAPATPSQISNSSPPKDQSPLIENLQLPSAAPQLSRPEHLHPTERITIPKTDPTPPKHTTQSTPLPPEPEKPEAPPQPGKVKPAVKPAPALPELSTVTPFKRIEREAKPNDVSASKNLEESLKRTLPSIPPPLPTPKIQRKPKPFPSQPEKPFVPEMSAPQLAKINPSQPLEETPQREKMSKMMEQLLGQVKVPNLKSSPATTPVQQPVPSSAPSTKPVQSEIDQRIAKLSIPNVTPVESIKKRLELLEVPSTSNPGNISSQPSPGKNRYLAMVQDKIDQQWIAPPLVASAPVVVLKFRISRSGAISNIHIDESSGNGHYDSAAQRAVYAVNPLPPFPADISDSFFEVRFRFIKD